MDRLMAAAGAWRDLTSAIGPLSFDFNPGNAKAITSLINDFLGSGKFSMTEPLVVQLLTWLSEYERHNVHVPEADPAEVLRHLMISNNLKQADLSGELGGQSVVSAILSGRREINVRQARALAARFGVSAAVFIATAGVAQDPGFKRGLRKARTNTSIAELALLRSPLDSPIGVDAALANTAKVRRKKRSSKGRRLSVADNLDSPR